MTPKETVIQFQTAVAENLKGRPANIQGYLHDDIQWHLPLSLDALCNGAERRGKDDVVDLIKNTVQRFYRPETMAFDFYSMIAENDLVHMHFALHAETPDGRAYHNRYQTLFRVMDGKIAEVWEYFDAGILLALYGDAD